MYMTAKIQKQPKYPSAGKRMDKMGYDHTMVYYSGIGRHEVRIHATAWMDLKTC